MTMSPIARKVAGWIDGLSDESKRHKVFWIVQHLVLSDVFHLTVDEREPPDAQMIFDFLSQKYVQRSDARQRTMGLQYLEAETHDLADELARWLATVDAPAHLAMALREAHQRIAQLERGEYICQRCGLRKDDDAPPAEF